VKPDLSNVQLLHLHKAHKGIATPNSTSAKRHPAASAPEESQASREHTVRKHQALAILCLVMPPFQKDCSPPLLLFQFL